MSDAALIADHWRRSVPRFRGLPILETTLALLCLLLFSQALLGPLFESQADPAGNPVLRLIWPPVYALILLLIGLQPAKFWVTMVRSWPILVLCILPMVSTLWSIDPGLSLRRGLAVLMTGVFGLWLASRYSWSDLVQLLSLVFGILAFGSLVAAIVFPGFGVDQDVHAGAWKGLWWEKNTLGAVFAFSSLSAACAAWLSKNPFEKLGFAALCLLSIGLVLMSTSRTALLACMICLLGVAAIWIARRGFGFASLVFLVGMIVVSTIGFVLIIGPGIVLEMLGRDPTLTGRTDIWEGSIAVIADKPLTGYGFGAFWAVENGPVFWLRQVTQWSVPTAHNAWLETALALGIPATIFAGLCVAHGFGRALFQLLRGSAAIWSVPFLTAWCVVSMSESILLEPNGFIWVMLSATLAKLMARTV
jgi:O-antigen ligase